MLEIRDRCWATQIQPLNEAMTHERRGWRHEGRMVIDTSRGPQRAASRSVEPSDRSFDPPAMASEALCAFDSAASDSLRNAALPECGSAAVVVSTLIGGQLRRSVSKGASWSRDCRNGVDHGLERPGFVDVRSRHADRERDTLRVAGDVVLRAEVASVRGVRARLLTPPSFLRGAQHCSRSLGPNRSRPCARVRQAAPRATRSTRRPPAEIAEAAPACHAKAAARLFWQLFPLVAGLQHEKAPVSAAGSSTRGRPPLGYSPWEVSKPRSVPIAGRDEAASPSGLFALHGDSIS